MILFVVGLRAAQRTRRPRHGVLPTCFVWRPRPAFGQTAENMSTTLIEQSFPSRRRSVLHHNRQSVAEIQTSAFMAVNAPADQTRSPRTESPASVPSLCFKCKISPATLGSVPCGCTLVCKACAMKMATGGKCRVCSNMFGSFKSLS
jgi:hypothetical protein